MALLPLTTDSKRSGSGQPDALTTDPKVDELSSATTSESTTAPVRVHYRVYKRRWLGLGVLMLLNLIVSWGWLTYAPVADLSQEWFELRTQTPVNWLSTAPLFAYAVASPAVIYTLSHLGTKPAIMASSLLLLSGAWIRYAGARTQSFPTTMVGQILIGFAQPFVLSAPTYYSDMWFTSRGRISATALASLSNPVGAAIGQLVNPFLATKASDIPDMVLWVGVITSVAVLSWFLVPASPPTPPCASAAEERDKLSFQESWRLLRKNRDFWILWTLFVVYVGFFNAMSSLLNQIMLPYAYNADEAGIAGALLIVVGLICSAVICPLVDRTHAFLFAVRVAVPIIAVSYIAFIWAPTSAPGNLAPPYIVCAILGAASFSLLPVALEFAVEITCPVGPELTSSLMWTGGQITGAVFILVMDAMRVERKGRKGDMFWALVFEAAVAVVVVPGVWMIRGKRRGRLEIEGVEGGEG